VDWRTRWAEFRVLQSRVTGRPGPLASILGVLLLVALLGVTVMLLLAGLVVGAVVVGAGALAVGCRALYLRISNRQWSGLPRRRNVRVIGPRES